MHVSEVPTTHKSTITLLTLFPLLRNRLVLYHNRTFSSTINLDEMADPACVGLDPEEVKSTKALVEALSSKRKRLGKRVVFDVECILEETL